MASASSQRAQLAKLCSSKEWSKAIRILDSIVSQSGAIQDIWCVLILFFAPLRFRFFLFLSQLRLIDNVIFNLSLVLVFSNRAFCYSQLELHKHVIKDCDRALELDPARLQAYILKGVLLIKFIPHSMLLLTACTLRSAI